MNALVQGRVSRNREYKTEPIFPSLVFSTTLDMYAEKKVWGEGGRRA